MRREEEEEAHEKEHVAGDAKGVSRGSGLRPNKPGLPEPHRRIGPKKFRTYTTKAGGDATRVLTAGKTL